MNSSRIYYRDDNFNSKNITVSDNFMTLLATIGNDDVNTFIRKITCNTLRPNEINLNKEGLSPFDFIDVRTADSGLISYMPAGRTQQFTPDGKWKREGRQTIKVGKFMNKLFAPSLLEQYKITDPVLETIANSFKTYGNQENIVIEVVSSTEDIKEAYLGDNYHSTYDTETYPGRNASSSLHESCMRYDKCQKWFNCYGEEDDVEMVVMRDKTSGKVLARAILWKNLTITDDGTGRDREGQSISLMDRVYALREWMIDAMLDWANDNGHYRKYKQCMDVKQDVISPEGNLETLELEYTFQREYSYFPYLDTMSYMESDKRTIKNISCDYAWELNGYEDGNAEINGDDSDDVYVPSRGEHFDREDTVFSEAHDEYYHEDDANYVPSRGDYFPNNYTTYVPSRNEYFHEEDVTYVESRDEYCYKEDVVFSAELGDDYHINDVRYISSRNDYFLLEDTMYVTSRSEYMYVDDTVAAEMIDGGTEIMAVDDCEELNGVYYESGHPELEKTKEEVDYV